MGKHKKSRNKSADKKLELSTKVIAIIQLITAIITLLAAILDWKK